MMVKICGITNRDDAIAAVEAGASAIGFNFYRDSPRYISHTGAAMIAEKIPANVWKVGIFVDEDPDAIARGVVDAGLDIVQLYGIAEARGIRIWRACSITDSLDSYIADETVEALLVDSPRQLVGTLKVGPSVSRHHLQYGGTGKTYDWSRARGIPKKTIIAGGLDPDNVRQAIEEAQPWGVDACSGVEKSPGLKDHEKMTKFVKTALGL
jgi:phosphoribosylanthranilate isomerase